MKPEDYSQFKSIRVCAQFSKHDLDDSHTVVLDCVALVPDLPEDYDLDRLYVPCPQEF